MSTYRQSPALPKPVVVVMKRSIFAIAMTTIVLAMLSFFVLILCGRTTVDCARSANMCRIVVEHGPGLVALEKAVPLTSVTRATVESHVDSDGDKLEGVAIVIDGKSVTLDGSSNVDHDGKVQWANELNGFLEDPSRDRVELQRGVLWPSYVWLVIVLAVLIVVVRARTAFVIDKAAGRLRIVRRFLRSTTEEIPLSDVASAEVHEEVSDDTIVWSVVLKLKDGTQKIVCDDSNIKTGGKRRAVEQLNQALSGEAWN